MLQYPHRIFSRTEKSSVRKKFVTKSLRVKYNNLEQKILNFYDDQMKRVPIEPNLLYAPCSSLFELNS
jgi:hypothetical protein